jgi:hypothetical protein
VHFFTSGDPNELGLPENPTKVIRSFNKDFKALKVFLLDPSKGFKKVVGDDDEDDEEDRDDEID